MAKIRLSPMALNDLKEIKSYIENDLSNPIAAKNVIKRIIDDYNKLEISPYMGTPLSAKVPFETDYRFMVSGNYIIFYKADEEFVSIYRILYGRRDYIRIIFDDISDEDEE
ncbi:MAG: type II toxin-antitoxin system RelE/ParE family toxin [Clostridia bacterium]|nr:type II toxin-antitoxin system RelE/ParE family toxin [Clostridia bacterium]